MVAARLAQTLNIEEAPSERDMSQRLPMKPEPTRVPRKWHGKSPGHSSPGGCQYPFSDEN